MNIEFLSEVNFDEVINKNKIVLVDFYASWCGPCKMLSKVLEQLSKERDDFLIGKLNIDFEKMIVERYKVYTVPTLMVFKDGVMVKRSLGYKTKEQILSLILD